MYKIFLTEEAETHIEFFKKNDKRIIKKINDLIEDTIKHPKDGIGKPEQLKHKDFITYSRRITKFHRMVYIVDEDKSSIKIMSLHGHY